MDDAAESEVRREARVFIEDALKALEREHVVPAPRFAPHVRVGRDYFGDTIHATPSYAAFERSLSDRFPDRFSPAPSGTVPVYPSEYIFSFVNAAVYNCTVAGDGYAAGATGIAEAVDQLVSALRSDSETVAVCRIVTHLTTASGQRVQIGDVVVSPSESDAESFRQISTIVPGTGGAVSREPPFTHRPPQSVVWMQRSVAADLYGEVQRLSADLERFLLAARLLTATTAQSALEVGGSTSRVSRMVPFMDEFRAEGFLDTLIRRTARLSSEDHAAIEGVLALLSDRVPGRSGDVRSSFDVALRLFNQSFQGAPWPDRLLDLVTALEATIIGVGDDSAGLSLRLRQRTSTLLWTDEDTASAIFGDVDLLYRLRSALVHGGDLKEKDLRRWLRGISTVPSDSPLGLAGELAVDRLRDLVRRSVLARVVLAGGDDPPWPFGLAVAVDRCLADDEQRARWRRYWHGRLAEVGAGAALGRARRAVSASGSEDT